MKKQADLAYLLKAYSIKQKSPHFDLLSFCVFLQKYAHHYVQDIPELNIYLDIGTEKLAVEMKKLKQAGLIEFTPDENGNGNIIVPQYYIDQVKRVYKNMNDKITIPFPNLIDIPKNISDKFAQRISLDDSFMEMVPTKEKNEFLYAIELNPRIPIMLFPSSLTIERLLLLSLGKLKSYLEKDESADYIFKRLSIANPGKQFSIKAFISRLQSRSQDALNSIKDAGEGYILWGQTCTFIRQELDKRSEKLAEETAVLQGITIIEYASSYYRNTAQKSIQRETALKNLNLELQKAPYYFSQSDISKFRDSRGIPLLGQYSQEDLNKFIEEKTSISTTYSVPDLCTFAAPNGENFFVLTEKMIPLIILLVNNSRKSIQRECIKIWKEKLMKFIPDDSMNSNKNFEIFLKNLTERNAPNLYALLNSPFLKTLAEDVKMRENQPIESARIFPHGKISSYTDLLLINREETLRDTKILLPFWYTIPFISSIISFFKRPKKQKKTSKHTKKETKKESSTQQQVSVKEKALELIDTFIPTDSSIDSELEKYLDLWNQNLDPTLRKNLTEDVNALIRDYLRGIQRTLSVKNLTEEHIHSISSTLINRPGLIKIGNKKALQNYIELYLLSLMKQFF